MPRSSADGGGATPRAAASARIFLRGSLGSRLSPPRPPPSRIGRLHHTTQHAQGRGQRSRMYAPYLRRHDTVCPYSLTLPSDKQVAGRRCITIKLARNSSCRARGAASGYVHWCYCCCILAAVATAYVPCFSPVLHCAATLHIHKDAPPLNLAPIALLVRLLHVLLVLVLDERIPARLVCNIGQDMPNTHGCVMGCIALPLRCSTGSACAIMPDTGAAGSSTSIDCVPCSWCCCFDASAVSPPESMVCTSRIRLMGPYSSNSCRSLRSVTS